MALTKSDIVNELASIGKGTIFTRRQSADLVESLLEIIKQTLESGEDVLISRFGKFCVKDKKKRRGRNPQTGHDMALDARRVVTFRCSGVLRDKINGKNIRRQYTGNATEKDL
jgi:integration host factor subunit alpha